MPLIKCRQCKAETTSKAEFCPRCYARLRMPGRSVFGKIVKYTFILFNILIPVWLIATVIAAVSADSDSSMFDPEATFIGLGAGVWALMIVGIWVAGSVILGILTLVTRP